MRSPGDWRRHWPLFVPVCVSSILSSWALGTVGWGNTYYSAAVRSMSESWRAFWYGAFDRAGFVTVDKPPFSLWVQALVVRVFGFHPMSLLVPQVVAGVSTVVLVYSLLVGRWGRLAATVGALVLAVTPMSVMVAHSNNTDAVLVLAMAATLYGVVRAIDSGRWSWTIGTGLLFGIAFTTKMLAAAPVLPAVVLAFALGSPLARAPRMRRLAVLSAVAVMSALFWFSAVDLTPDASRPYVGSSADNSAFQLAFERNGINQVEGGQVMTGGPGGPPPGGPPPGMGPGGRPGSAPPPGLLNGLRHMIGGFDGGEPGPLRLFNAELGTQIGWVIVPALIALIALLAVRRRALARDPVIVGAVVWFVGAAGVYSITKGIVHPYYVATLAPPLAVLVGAGTGLARECRERRFAPAVLGAALAISSVVSWVIARRSKWTLAAHASLLLVVAGVVVGMSLASSVVPRRLRQWVAVLPLVCAVVPSIWTVGSLRAGTSPSLPFAEPIGIPAFGRPRLPASAVADRELLAYLRTNRGAATWLVAAPSAMAAAPIIIETGEAVMALGGFSGGDPILTADEFDTLVATGRVRFVMADDRRGPPPGPPPGAPPPPVIGSPPVGPPPTGAGRLANTVIMRHVEQTCHRVPSVETALFDCSAASGPRVP